MSFWGSTNSQYFFAKISWIFFFFFPNENQRAFHMRYHLFLHYGWFPQNLKEGFIWTNMHTTVAVQCATPFHMVMFMYDICHPRSLVSNDMLDCHPLHCLQLIVPLNLALEASVSFSYIQVPCICSRKLQLPVDSLDSTEADKIITRVPALSKAQGIWK